MLLDNLLYFNEISGENFGKTKSIYLIQCYMLLNLKTKQKYYYFRPPADNS